MGKVVIFFGIFIVVLFIGGGLTIVAYKLRPSLLSRWIPSAQSEEVKKEIDGLVAEIGRLIELPEGELPTVATVSDVEKLKTQDFFLKAQNGDKVLFYTKAKKAILYRPSLKKIIDIAPLTVGDPSTGSATGSAKTTPTPAPVKVTLLNGSSVAGLTSTAERKLKAVKGVVVTLKDNARASTYTKTTVVNLNNVRSETLNQIASALSGTVDTLPAGEVAPDDADIVVILAP